MDKYLAEVFDPKLSWNNNIIQKAEEATRAVYIHKKTVGNICLYRAVVGPTLLYAQR